MQSTDVPGSGEPNHAPQPDRSGAQTMAVGAQRTLEPALIRASLVDRRAYRLLQWVSVLLLLTWVFALSKDERLPPVSDLVAALGEEPIQSETTAAPFERRVKDMTYLLVPVARYDLKGLVVSEHDSKTWWDYIHQEVGDFINVNDLCVVWGPNALTGSYQQVKFSSSEFTCEFEPRTPAAAQSFRFDGVANNHMLTEDAQMARRLRGLRRGDQIRFTGLLVNYANLTRSPDSFRNTSTTRTDSGNGACEVVYVTGLEVLHAAPRIWTWVRALCLLGLLGCLLVWLALPYRPRP